MIIKGKYMIKFENIRLSSQLVQIGKLKKDVVKKITENIFYQEVHTVEI